MVVLGARERMFCHVTLIHTPCSGLLACRPADLICRIAGVGHSDAYAAFGKLIRGSVRPGALRRIVVAHARRGQIAGSARLASASVTRVMACRWSRSAFLACAASGVAR